MSSLPSFIFITRKKKRKEAEEMGDKKQKFSDDIPTSCQGERNAVVLFYLFILRGWGVYKSPLGKEGRKSSEIRILVLGICYE